MRFAREVPYFLERRRPRTPGAWVWISVEDAEALFEEYRASGAKLRHPPTNHRWAFEMQIEDLDGNIFRMGSEPKENEPAGEWLDMCGKRWAGPGLANWSVSTPPESP